MDDYILQMQQITKTFPGVKALDQVTFHVKRGEIHALVGENGAGKSTLMKVLSGVYTTSEYDGDILIDGAKQDFRSIKDSEKHGVAIIHQELALCKNMNICESMFLGSEIKNRFGIIDWNATYKKCSEYLSYVNLDLNPKDPIIGLGVGQQQLIEICKAISKNARILILDEPTAALTDKESDNLLKLLKGFQKDGVTCIYISHKLDEVFKIADTITVLRDGQTVVTKPADQLDKKQLIAHMVGRELTQMFPREEHTRGKALLEVKNWNVYHPELTDKKVIDDVSMTAYEGEILGIAGLMGAGRTELMMSIIGEYGSRTDGELFLNGKPLRLKSTAEAIANGVGYVSEERKRYGLVLEQDIKFNAGLSSFEKLSKYYLINDNELISQTGKYIQELKIKTPSMEQTAKNLSGGNQQKVVLAKWMMTHPQVLIMDEPTRGIDVGAKVEIYHIMNQLVKEGVGIVMISSELQEVIGMSDRILVMYEGRLAKELFADEATQENIMYYATGGK